MQEFKRNSKWTGRACLEARTCYMLTYHANLCYISEIVDVDGAVMALLTPPTQNSFITQ